jgi:hypothetical protein
MQSIKPLDWPPEIYPKHLLILKEVLGAAMLSLSVAPGWRQSIFAGYIPATQSIQASPSQDHIHTFLKSPALRFS